MNVALKNVALKEWAVVIEALARGEQRFLLRKGGIAEGRRGFEVRYREFLLFPTWEHQQMESIRPPFHALFAELFAHARSAPSGPAPSGTYPSRPAPSGAITFRYLARVSDVLEAPPELGAMEQLSAEHIWTPSYLRMRYSYRPERPLFILLLRPYRLGSPKEIPEIPRYAGCRSWVTLDDEVDCASAAPTEPDESFEAARKSLLEKLVSHGARAHG